MRFAVLALSLALASSCSDSAEPAVATGAIEGRALLDGADDHALVLIAVDGVAVTVATSPEGRYRLAGLDPGSYRIFASRAGYNTATSDPLDVRGAATTNAPDLVLTPKLTRIRGRVQLEGRTRHEGVAVAIANRPPAMSAADGSFALEAIPPGTYTVVASLDGFADARSVTLVLAGEPEIDVGTLVLRVGRGELRGVVRLSDSDDHSGTSVVLQGQPWTTFTARDGAYLLADIPVGQYSLVATRPGYASRIATDVLVARDATTDVPALVLDTDPCTLEGVAELEGATTHDGIIIAIPALGLTTTTRVDGGFTLPGVPAGTHVVTATKDAFVTAASTPTTVAAGATATVPSLFLAIATGHLEGQVTLLGRNDHAGIYVVVRDTPYAAFTTPSGAWRFNDLPVGQYTIVASYIGFATRAVPDVVVARDVTTAAPNIALTADPARIRGTVVLEALGPTAGVTLAIAGTDATATTDAAGGFELGGLAPGTWTVTASFDQHDPVGATTSVAAGGDATLPELTLFRSRGDLEGVVDLPGTNDDSGVQVTLADTALSVVTTSSGAYRFSAVPVGQYTVVAGRVGYTTATATDVTVRSKVTTTVLPLALAANPGTITGRVALEGGATPGGVAITLSGLGLTTTTGADGGYRLTGVPLGTYSITARKDTFDAATTPSLTVPAGGSVEASPLLLARSRGSLAGRVDLAATSDDSGVQVSLANTPYVTTSAPGGEFLFTSIPTGQYTLVATRAGFTTATATDLEVEAGMTTSATTLVLATNPGSITGNALLEGETNHGAIALTIVGTGLTTQTDSRGAFTLSGVPAGTHTLRATRTNFETTTSAPVTVSAGGTIAMGTIALARSRGDLVGQVDLVGSPDDSGAIVVVQGTAYAATTTVSGQFAFSRLPVGQYAISVTSSGYATATKSDLTVVANATTTATLVSLQPVPGSVSGKVVLDDGASANGVVVRVDGTSLQTTASSDGSFVISDVAMGYYSLTALHPGYDAGRSGVIAIAPGVETAIGTLVLARSTGGLAGRVAVAGRSDHSGALVSLQGTPYATLSAPDGGYSFSDLPTSQYTVVASLSGFTTASASDLAVVASTTTSVGDLVLAANPGSINGVARREGGSDHSGIALTILGTGITTTSDSGGTYTLSGVPAGNHVVRATATGFDTTTTPALAVPAGGSIAAGTLTLARSRGGLTGKVDLAGTDDDSGVLVSIEGSAYAAISTQSGDYVFERIPIGQYTVKATRSGFASAQRSDVAVLADATTDVPTLVLGASPGSISGKVVLEGGASPEGVLVRVDGTSLEAIAEADGDFVIAGVAAGYHTATATVGYASKQSNLVQVAPGADTPLGTLFLARATGGLRGFATMTGRVDHAGLEVVVLGTGFSALTASDGSWHIAGVPTGGYSVRFAAPTFATQTLTDQVVVADTEVELTTVVLVASPGTLTGTALRVGSNDHLGILVLVNGTAFQGATDVDGAWTIGGIPAGTYTLQYEAQDHKAVTAGPIQVLAGQTLAVGSVSLEPAEGKVQGYVALEARAVQTGATVAIGANTTSTDPSGYWELTLPIGNYTGVTASAPPYFAPATYGTNFTVTKQGIANIPLLSLDAVANDVVGVVGRYGTNDASGLHVRLQGRDPGTAAIDLQQLTASNGVYTFDAVPLGEYRVTLSYATGWETWTEDFELEPGPAFEVQTRELAQRYIRIANDATWTKSTSPNLTLGSSDAVKMCLTNDAPGTCPEPWPDFAPSVAAWPLSVGDGDKQVCATFRDSFGVSSVPICDTVTLDSTASIASVTFTPLGQLTRGSILHVELEADELYAGVASFDLGSYAVGISLKDNGLSGDAIAGDGVYSADYRIADSRDVPSPGATITGRFRDWLGNEGTSVAGSVTIGSPPRITNLEIVPDSEAQTATITWTTDEPATTKLRWGTSPAYGATYEPSASLFLTSHTATIEDLDFGIEYHFRAYGSDAAGNEGFSLDRTFFLRPNPPTNVVAMPGDTRFDIRWEAPPQSNVVGYNVYKSATTGGPYPKQNTGLYTHDALMYSEVPSTERRCLVLGRQRPRCAPATRAATPLKFSGTPTPGNRAQRPCADCSPERPSGPRAAAPTWSIATSWSIGSADTDHRPGTEGVNWERLHTASRWNTRCFSGMPDRASMWARPWSLLARRLAHIAAAHRDSQSVHDQDPLYVGGSFVPLADPSPSSPQFPMRARVFVTSSGASRYQRQRHCRSQATVVLDQLQGATVTHCVPRLTHPRSHGASGDLRGAFLTCSGTRRSPTCSDCGCGDADSRELRLRRQHRHPGSIGSST